MMQAGSDSDDLMFGSEDSPKTKKTFRHPIALLFHMLFRAAALITYLFCGWFSDSFILGFVLIVLFLSMDFWTVKNITGRLLVSLRWWNYIDDEGVSHWVYESRKGADAQKKVSAADARLFWFALVLAPVFWILLLLAALFTLKFKWLMVCVVGVSLTGANLFGYLRCRVGSLSEARSTATSFFSRKLLTSLLRRSKPAGETQEA